MKKMKKTGVPTLSPGTRIGSMPLPPREMGMGGMGGPMMKPPVARPPIPALPIRRPPLMKTKGMPLAGFMPGPKKVRRGKKGQKRLVI